MSETDGEVVEAVLAGHTNGFALLVRRHQGMLFRHALSLGLDQEEAADVVQDTLVRAYENLGECREPDRFHVWVGRILRNRCLDHLKSAASRRNTRLEPHLPDDQGRHPERDHERTTLKARLDEAMNDLPWDQREAFVLKHVEGHSYEDMARMLGLSVSALKMRVHRARERLKARLEAVGVDESVTSAGGTSS